MCTYKGHSQRWILAALIVSLVAGCGSSGGGGGVAGGGAGIPGPNPGTVSSAAGAVYLGTAGEYAVFGDTGIHTDANPSVITGNIGASPAVTSTAITGFALSLPAASTFSTSAQVNGRVYAYDYALPTPTIVNTASLYVGSAYTDAAEMAPTFTELGGGTLSNQTIVPGVYKWAGDVNILTNLTLSGSATDVWVFQVGGTLFMAAARNVIMSGGALPQNVFWQVAGAVTIGANTHFEGIILGKTSITFGNHASINGRLLAQSSVSLDATTVTRP